jgi:hypothetical protein
MFTGIQNRITHLTFWNSQEIFLSALKIYTLASLKGSHSEDDIMKQE